MRLLEEEWKNVTGNKMGVDFKSRLQEVVAVEVPADAGLSSG